MNSRPLSACVRALAAILCIGGAVPILAQTDLDAFMQQVLATRDANWKKLQQYVLDERETVDVRGPGHAQLWGDRREYTWFIRDGFFVRSPVRANGIDISEAERRKFEADYLKRQKEREARGQGPGAPAEPTPTSADVDSILKQTRQPQFISSAYFLRFRFEQGKYALAGRETFNARTPIPVLRIEYYPANLFRASERRRQDRDAKEPTAEEKAYNAELRRLMNKTALVTLWVEPKAHQIVKYTFDNIDFDFLPARWLLQFDELHASMVMDQPFPDVWLPSALEFKAAATLAVGQVDVRYGIDYHDYRRADVATKITIPKQ